MNIMKERTKSSPRHLSLNLRKKKKGKNVSLAAKQSRKKFRMENFDLEIRHIFKVN